MMTSGSLDLKIEAGIATVTLERPERANALDRPLWEGLRSAFRQIDEAHEVRVAILAGRGAHFCSGIDLGMLGEFDSRPRAGIACTGRANEDLRRTILDLQDVFTTIERCRKPVLAAVHGVCVGAGIDMIAACDLRYATQDARFAIREIDMGVPADVGALQRLPHLIGVGMTRELAYTGRDFDGREAHEIRLVNRCWEDAAALMAGVQEIARTLAAKSPLTLRGTKQAITYARDHTVADGLDQIATWNAGMLLSEDLDEATSAFRQKRTPRFRD